MARQRDELPDARTIDMTIRDGVEWSDGEPFTPDDVVFTFDLIKANPALDLKGAWQHIDTIEQQGDHVVFHLQTDDVPAMDDHRPDDDRARAPLERGRRPDDVPQPDPVGTGPFTLGNYSAQQYSMDKNESYWQAEKIDIAHLILPATNNQLDTVTRGYDWAYSFISDVEGTWGAASDTNSYWFPPGGVIGLMPNLTKAPFDDVNVRNGIALALDRDQIAESATEGYLEPRRPDRPDPAQPAGVPRPRHPRRGHDRPGRRRRPRRLRAGRLHAAGRPAGRPRRPAAAHHDHSPPTATPTGCGPRRRSGAQLGAIGIDVQIQAPQPAGYQSAIANGEFDMAIGGMGNGNIYQAFNTLLNSDFATPVGKTTAQLRAAPATRPPTSCSTSARPRPTPPSSSVRRTRCRTSSTTQLPVIGLYYGGLWGLFNDCASSPAGRARRTRTWPRRTTTSAAADLHEAP